MAKRGGTLPDVIRFLQAVDARIEAESHEVWISGGAAVLLAYEGELATVDVDFVGERRGVLRRLASVAAKDSEIHDATNLCTDVVAPGLFLSEFGWRNRAIAVTVPGLTHLRLRVLEIHDLVLSKLKRFSAKDRNDIRHLVGRPKSTTTYSSNATEAPACYSTTMSE